MAYEVIVVGGGHAGTEAAFAAARMGARVLLVTQHMDNLGQLSCNPSIGGIGKSHLVREVEALGGEMGRLADAAAIHVRTLNTSRGYAVRATRAQIDRLTYRAMMQRTLQDYPQVACLQDRVDALLLSGTVVQGVRTQLGFSLWAPTVILTTGTFLNGCVHIGLQQYGGGRVGEPPAQALGQQLLSLGLSVARFKTGTPPRLDGRTIDWSVMTEQPTETPRPLFSPRTTDRALRAARSCWLTHTTPETHEIIRASLSDSPLFSGQIQGKGPRYCPSIEDKVFRFAQRDTHHVFLEPEGLESIEIYPNGISTSLPLAVQVRMIQSMPGLSQTRIMRPGYAIEYDYIDPMTLRTSMESQQIEGLFLAGQINGTTGYEEAAAQGLMAGMNAVRRIQGEAPVVWGRHEAYLGVLVDDLTTQGILEPYRMFTSRAEFRLQLRDDNAEERLTPLGRRLGLVDDTQWALFEERQSAVASIESVLHATRYNPQVHHQLQEEAHPGETLAQVLAKTRVSCQQVLAAAGYETLSPDLVLSVDVRAKYAGYLARQAAEIARLQRHDDMIIPSDFVFDTVPGLSHEVRERLATRRPRSLGEARRLPGITPAAMSLLLVYLTKHTATGPHGSSQHQAAS